tara:strand:+ start:7125 stop:7265 length:141 start_codon:yes stop_codon:yes gene_type:complete
MDLAKRLEALQKQEEDLKTMFIKVQGAKELVTAMIEEEKTPKKKGK